MQAGLGDRRRDRWVPAVTSVALVGVALATVVVRSSREDVFATVMVYGRQLERSSDGRAPFAATRSGQHVDVGNRLRTDAAGRGELDYYDRSVTRLDHNTRFVVKDLGSADRPVRAHLDVGRAWSNVRRTSGQNRFEIATPVAVATVRGTTFDVACNPRRTCMFTVLTGLVRVDPRNGDPVDLGPLSSLTVGPDGRVVTPPGRTRPPVTAVRPEDLAADEWLVWNAAIEATGAPPAATPATPVAGAPAVPAAATATPRPTARGAPTPVATPRGSEQLAFLAEAPNQGGREVYVLRFDGSGLRRVTTTPTNLAKPHYSGLASSPDGARVAFVRSYPNTFTGIQVVNADGSGERRLTDGKYADYAPTWSPDGTRIAYQGQHDENGSAGDFIWTISATDGSGPSVLRAGVPARCPAWSPDGSRIMFHGVDGLFTIRPDGTGFTRITRGYSKQPSWSLDGARIAYEEQGSLFVARADGTGAVRIAQRYGNYPIGGVVWTPDGRLVFSGRPSWDAANVGGLWSVGADGSNPRNLLAGTNLTTAYIGC